MKRLLFFSLAAAIAMFWPWMAEGQFVNTVPGTKLIYNLCDKNGEVTGRDTSTVLRVSNSGNLTVARVQLTSMKVMAEEDSLDINDIFENAFGSATYEYDASTQLTKQTYLDGKVVAKALAKAAIASKEKDSGRKLTEGEKENILKKIDGDMVKGSLSLPIRGDAVSGEVFAPSEFVMNMGVSLKISFTEGRYLGRESVTTPVGEYNCLKISYVRRVKFMIISETEYVTSWFAEGLGLVKEECRDKKGRLQEMQVLVQL